MLSRPFLLLLIFLSFSLTVMSSISSVFERKKGAMLGMYVADAVAMPVHWMYNLGLLQRDYGKITGYMKPKDKFEGSIMNLSNTGGGGRGSDQGDIVGSVILHGKKKFWLRGGNFHYHYGLEAGMNTLEAELCKVLSRSLTEQLASSKPLTSSQVADNFRERYMHYMQTPGLSTDTYAATAHRMFFANLVKGVDPKSCADNDGHNTDGIDALTLTVPVIVAFAEAPRAVRNDMIRDVIAVTRRSSVLQKYAEQYADILTDGLLLYSVVSLLFFSCSLSFDYF
jgi:ADP-ribosyl-[dinitrogen reductase] hydrolase